MAVEFSTADEGLQEPFCHLLHLGLWLLVDTAKTLKNHKDVGLVVHVYKFMMPKDCREGGTGSASHQPKALLQGPASEPQVEAARRPELRRAVQRVKELGIKLQRRRILEWNLASNSINPLIKGWFLIENNGLITALVNEYFVHSTSWFYLGRQALQGHLVRCSLSSKHWR